MLLPTSTLRVLGTQGQQPVRSSKMKTWYGKMYWIWGLWIPLLYLGAMSVKRIPGLLHPYPYCLEQVGKLPDKVFLITGCSSGIGVETAKALHATGAHLLLTGRQRLNLFLLITYQPSRLNSEKHCHSLFVPLFRGADMQTCLFWAYIEGRA